MNIDTSKLLWCHQNPLIKMEIPPKKLTRRKNTPDTIQLENKHFATLQNIVSHHRVESRSSRSKAISSVDEPHTIKLTKIIGKFLYGTQNKRGKFLTPIEALHLVECNKLEIYENDLPLSVQQLYNRLVNLFDYRICKKFLMYGYRVQSLDSREETEPESKRQRLSPKLTYDHSRSSHEVFEKLSKFSPKVFDQPCTSEPDLIFKSPKDANQREVIIRSNCKYDMKDFQGEPTTIYAFSTGNHSGLFRFKTVNIPIL